MIATLFGFAVVMALAGLVMAACQGTYRRRRDLRIAPSDSALARDRRRSLRVNGATAIALYLAVIVAFTDQLVHDTPSRWWEAPAALALYDFLYYWLCRGLHLPNVMRHVHGVHHQVRHPTAQEGLYLHPLDTAIALLLMVSCVVIVGPVGTASFCLAVFLHTVINTLDHANLKVPLVRHCAVWHDAHHDRRDVNYAAILPVWDWVFRTAK